MEHDVCRRRGSVRRDERGGRATAGGVECGAGERRNEDKPDKDEGEGGDKKDTGGTEELEGGVRSAMWQENASEAERENLQDSSTTSHDV